MRCVALVASLPSNTQAISHRHQSQFFFDTETWDAVPNITSNILLIGGENDVMVPVGSLKDIAARAQSPWMVVYKHAGHAVLEQYHESVMGNINNFLDWVGVYGDE